MVFKMLFADTASTVRAGETLNGSLQICSTHDIPAQHLLVEWVGEECASVGDGKRRRSDTQIIFRKEIDTSRTNHMIARRGYFPAGSGEVKFSMALPCGLPSSTLITHGSGSAKIQYSLRAVLKGSGTLILHRADKVVRVRALEPTANLPRVVRPRCQPVKGTLFHHGQVFCGAQAKQSLLNPGERVDIDLAVLNQSKTPIRTVKVVLRERVRWSAQKQSKTVMTNLVTHSIDADSATSSRASLDSSSNSNTTRRRSSLIRLNQEKKLEREQSLRQVGQQLRNSSSKDNNLLSFTLPAVPTQARNTHVGTRLCVTHEVILTLEPEGQVWKRNPEVRIPVRIFNDDEHDNSLAMEKQSLASSDDDDSVTEDCTTSCRSLELEASAFRVETKRLIGGAYPPASEVDSDEDAGCPNITISASA